jgi:dipeptide/tripeptide permease
MWALPPLQFIWVSLLERYDVNGEIVEKVKEHGIEGELKARGKPYQIIKPEVIQRIEAKGKLWKIPAIFLAEVSKPAGMVLTLLGLLAFGYLFLETFRLEKIARERMLAALVLIFFQMLFFAFFEQAGSSLNNFTDRNVERVAKSQIVTEEMVGQTIRIQPTQAQLGFTRADKVFTLSDLDGLRAAVKPYPQYTAFDISWTISEDNVGMNVANRLDELPASIFQSVNPTFILIFALVFNYLWASLRRLGLEPSAPVKFAFGLMQLGLGFGAFWMGAQAANDQGMVALYWLLLGYLLQTTGELCLSPVGLSTMTKLSPKALVSTLMGAWFLATAFSQYLAAIISQFTGVEEGSGGAAFPPPIETVNIYGDVFGKVALTAMACGFVCLILSPILTRWMHEDEVVDEA